MLDGGFHHASVNFIQELTDPELEFSSITRTYMRSSAQKLI